MSNLNRIKRKGRHYRKALRILKRAYQGKLARTRGARYEAPPVVPWEVTRRRIEEGSILA